MPNHSRYDRVDFSYRIPTKLGELASYSAQDLSYIRVSKGKR